MKFPSCCRSPVLWAARNVVWLFVLGFFASGFGSRAAECSVLDRLSHPLPKLTAEDLHAVTANNGSFYAVGVHGATLSSSDGQQWTLAKSATLSTLYAITGGSAGLVAVGEGGSTVFSSDGMTWESASVTPKTNLTGVAFGNGIFVAVGAGGNAYTSEDGKMWTAQPTGTTNDFVAVAYGSGAFVAASTASEVYVSVDGGSWVRYRLASPLVHLRPVSGGFFGLSADQRVASSVDGRVWSLVAKHSLTDVNDISANGGRLYAVGPAGSIYASADSFVWTPLAVPAAVAGRDLYGVTFENGIGVAVGEQGLLLRIDAAERVTNHNTDKFEDLHSVAFGHGWFVAVGDSGRIMAAQGATNAWQFPDSGITNDLAGIAFGQGKFLAVGGAFPNSKSGRHATVLSSVNATNWTPIFQYPALTNANTGELAWPTSIAFGADRFVCVAPEGAALISTNGTDWRTFFDPQLGGCTSVGFAGDHFIAVGTNILTSWDGLSWLPSLAVPVAPLTGVAGTIDRIVAVGTNPPVMLSTNLSTPWIPSTVTAKGGLGGVTYGGFQFVTVGSGGLILTSSDGTAWARHLGGTPVFLRSVAYGDGYYVIVGDGGTVINTTRIDTNTGLPGPSAWVRTGGGMDRDSALTVALDPACGFYISGSFLGTANFGGMSVAGTQDPSFYLTRYSDIGEATWSVTGQGIAWGTHAAATSGQVFAAGVAQDGIDIGGGEVLTSEGVGAFVASFDNGGGPMWLRQFPGTVSDLIMTRGNSIRFAGTFPGRISFGDELLLESTNTPLSFFLIKAETSGTNVWGRYIEPTKGFLDGMKLAADSKSATYAAGTAGGLLKFWAVDIIPPTPPDPNNPDDPGSEGGGFTNVLTTQITISNGPSVFLSKYDANGKLLWVTNTGMQGAIVSGAAADGSGGVLLAGNSGSDMFIARFDTNGVAGWRRVFPTQGNAQLTAFASTTNGWSIAAGFFQGNLTIGKTELTTGGTACFVMRLDPFGALVTVQSYGTADAIAGYSAPTALAAESTREYVLAGYFDERVSFGPGELVTRGLSDAFMARLRTPPESGGKLEAEVTDAGLIFDFPAGYVLQTSPTVDPGIWTSIPGDPPIFVPTDAAPGYYRLIWP